VGDADHLSGVDPAGHSQGRAHGSHFDVWSSTAIIIGYAMPAFLFAMLLIVVFAGGTSLNWFPVRGLVSDNFDRCRPWARSPITSGTWCCRSRRW
jgi:ABC-type microcin C transport system permease subunit YejB